MRILLLEDDALLAESLKEFLELEGFIVDLAINGEEVYELSFNNRYDLYILDINVPKDNGFEVLKHLKEAGDNTPTIYISALTDINSISKGFNLGAIDYIKKPFDPMELVVRIKNRFLQNSNEIEYKDIKYNIETKEIYKKDKLINLGETQLAIFDKLIKNKNKIVLQEELIEYLDKQSSNALRVAISKLKNKLDLNIKNVRGKGYILEEVWARIFSKKLYNIFLFRVSLASYAFYVWL